MLYSFENYTLDTDRRELHRGTHLVAVQPQVFDLLQFLIRHRGRVVSKDDLIGAIWGGRIVSESALDTRINAARTAIGDSGKEQRLIRTLLRKGVRFVGTVREEDPASRAAMTSTEAPQTREPAPAQPAATVPQASGEQATIAAILPEPPAPAAHLALKVSERRQLTIALCELLAPQSVTLGLELEDLDDAIASYHRWVADEMAQFSGIVAQRVGNIALVCFGYPAAREGDAEQAITAGLKLCASVRSNVHTGHSWQCRVGIATGMVIVSSPIAESSDAQKLELVGDPPGVGARLQALAKPGTVLIDQSTRQLVGDLFDCRDIGVIDASGTRRGWEVLGSGSAESRFAALHAAALTPLVGRDEEVDLLVRRWEQATSGGEERVVLISGEPGIGKSRLLADLELRLQSQKYARLHFSCSPQHADSAFHPIVSQLERSIGFEPDETSERKFARLASHLAAAEMLADDVALLADLMSLPASNGDPLRVSPQRKKELTSEAVVRRIANLARDRPVLMIFEDMHWIDPTSLDVVSLAIERLQSLPVLMLITFRTEFEPPWLGQPNVTMMLLRRLGGRESIAMVQQVAGDAALPDGVLDEVVRRTDGVPLYIEELTKAAMESGGVPDANTGWSLRLRALAVPPTLQTSLMARLDRIGPAKQIAQVGAAIGREFSYELLSAVVDQTGTDLQSTLERLTDTGLVFRRGLPPRNTYVFKHALIQDAAYSTLLRRRRQELHARIATALETRFSDMTALQPEILAHHLLQAGQPGNAAQYWIRAGDLASRRSGTSEAAGHYRAALRDLSAEPEDAPIRQIEPEVHMKLGNVLIQSEGYGSPSAIGAYRRAQASAAALDQPENYAKAAIGLGPLLFSDCRYREVASTLEDISEKLLDQLPTHTHIHLFTMLGVANYCLGDYSSAWDRLDAARALDQQSPCTHENPVGGGDPAIVIGNYMGMCGAVLGRLQESLALTEEALTIARTRKDAFTIAWAMLGRLRALRAIDEFSEGIVLGEEAVDICERHGFRARLGSILISCAINHLAIGNVERGLVDMRRGIDLWRETSGDFHMSEWNSHLIPHLLRTGRRNDADALLADAERIVDQTDERSHCAEIWRLRANVLARDGAVDEAASLLARAINWAGPRHAKVFELRASLDLAGLRLDADRPDMAASVLKHAVALFPNETVFDDLLKARDLLAACG